MTHKGKIAVVEDAFADSKGPSLKNTPKGTPLASKAGTPAASAAGTPAGSGAEDSPKDGAIPKGKKKKPTRNMMKAQEERRRKRKLDWLTFGGPKPEDTDSD